jgi:hypothetical protein
MPKKTTKTPKILKKVGRRGDKTRVPTVYDDFKSAALLVSITINVAVFIGWLAIKITTKFDEQIATFLFAR